MDLTLTPDAIILRKGLVFRRIHTIPLRCVVRVTVRRSILLRIFRAKEAELFTQNGKFKLFLRCDEAVPAFSKPPAHFIKPRLRETAFGAFIDVRALGGIALFAAVLRRIGTIFGGKYLENILDVLDTATENVEHAFSAMQIYVPRVAAALAVFALAAWAFAYLRKLAALSRFRVGRNGEYIVVTSGLFTLYEYTLVRYHAAPVICDSPASLAAKHAPIYLYGVMIYPCSDRASFAKLVHVLCGERIGKSAERLRPPKRALFGYCAAPLAWSGVFAAALALMYISDELRGAMLLKTALYCGLFVSLYASAVCMFYMKHSGVTFGERLCAVGARRSLRLYTAVFPRKLIAAETLSQSVFQQRSGLCNLKISAAERRGFKGFKLRLIPKDKLR